MDPSFWLERWQRNEIGFHNAAPHRGLQRWWPRLALPPGSRVFVPLAGKSLDMIWLAAQGHSVVGVELSASAVEAFAAENGPIERVDLRCGDIFELDAARLGPIQGVFDRMIGRVRHEGSTCRDVCQGVSIVIVSVPRRFAMR